MTVPKTVSWRALGLSALIGLSGCSNLPASRPSANASIPFSVRFIVGGIGFVYLPEEFVAKCSVTQCEIASTLGGLQYSVTYKGGIQYGLAPCTADQRGSIRPYRLIESKEVGGFLEFRYSVGGDCSDWDIIERLQQIGPISGNMARHISSTLPGGWRVCVLEDGNVSRCEGNKETYPRRSDTERSALISRWVGSKADG